MVFSVGAVLITLLVIDAAISERKTRKVFDAICNNITADPFFEIEAVIGKTWTVYFTWNMKMDEFCMELRFKYANTSVVNRVKHGIKDLKIKPLCDKAVLALSVTMSPDMLLFEDFSGISGRFIGVVDIAENRGRSKFQQKPHKMALKLLHNNQYLLMSDCNYGTTSLSLQKDNRPKREEIEAFAANFTFGDAFPACINEKDREK